MSREESSYRSKTGADDSSQQRDQKAEADCVDKAAKQVTTKMIGAQGMGP